MAVLYLPENQVDQLKDQAVNHYPPLSVGAVLEDKARRTHPKDAPPGKVVTPANGKTFTLEELQGYVGGYIQIEDIGGGLQMVMNEEGKLLDPPLPYNEFATAIFWLRPQGTLPGDYIAGPALVVTESELEP